MKQGKSKGFSFISTTKNYRIQNVIQLSNEFFRRENIRKKFQDKKLPLVDEVIALDGQRRDAIKKADQLKAQRNQLAKANGALMGRLKKTTDEAVKAELEAQFQLNLTKTPYYITDDLLFLGEIENNISNDIDDSALAYITQKGLLIITGCSHSGIINIIN